MFHIHFVGADRFNKVKQRLEKKHGGPLTCNTQPFTIKQAVKDKRACSSDLYLLGADTPQRSWQGAKDCTLLVMQSADVTQDQPVRMVHLDPGEPRNLTHNAGNVTNFIKKAVKAYQDADRHTFGPSMASPVEAFVMSGRQKDRTYNSEYLTKTISDCLAQLKVPFSAVRLFDVEKHTPKLQQCHTLVERRLGRPTLIWAHTNLRPKAGEFFKDDITTYDEYRHYFGDILKAPNDTFFFTDRVISGSPEISRVAKHS